MLEDVRAFEDIIVDELNVKTVAFGTHETELVTLRAKADFSRLGPRFGARVKSVAKAIAAMPEDRLEKLACGDAVTLCVEGEDVALQPGDVVIERIPKAHLVVGSEDDMVVALETDLSEDLIREGLAREFVNKVQNMRKTADLEVTQRIEVDYACDAAVDSAIQRHIDYVSNETLCTACRASAAPAGTDWDLNGHPCRIAIRPADRT